MPQSWRWHSGGSSEWYWYDKPFLLQDVHLLRNLWPHLSALSGSSLPCTEWQMCTGMFGQYFWMVHPLHYFYSSLQVNYEPFMKDLWKENTFNSLCIVEGMYLLINVFSCLVIFSHATLDIDAESADLWISITLLRSPWVFKKAQTPWWMKDPSFI